MLGSVLATSQPKKALRTVVWPIVRNCALWALLHSLLASMPAKRAAERVVGTRTRNGMYRVFYNAQAWLSFGWLVLSTARVPDRELLRLNGPPAKLLLLGRLGAALLTTWSGVILGPLRFNGMPQLLAYLQGRQPPPEDEGQGPIREHGRLKVTGPFQVIRHPANVGPFLFALFSPRITVKGATLTVLLGLYGVLGSLHEEQRLRARYGEEYEKYRHQVPFMVPRLPE
jgi:protein-S-isoprenylcysteine O-methyltransferase Ste14